MDTVAEGTLEEVKFLELEMGLFVVMVESLLVIGVRLLHVIDARLFYVDMWVFEADKTLAVIEKRLCKVH